MGVVEITADQVEMATKEGRIPSEIPKVQGETLKLPPVKPSR
jgi:hypothetical protein